MYYTRAVHIYYSLRGCRSRTKTPILMTSEDLFPFIGLDGCGVDVE